MAQSGLLNLAEHYEIAQGSANEVKAALDAAEAWCWSEVRDEERVVLDRLLAVLRQLTHSSSIQGTERRTRSWRAVAAAAQAGERATARHLADQRVRRTVHRQRERGAMPYRTKYGPNRRDRLEWRLGWPDMEPEGIAQLPHSHDVRSGTPRAPARGDMTTRSLIASSLLAALAACADPGIEDDLAVDDASEGDSAKADAGGTYTYYFIEQDSRKCASPFCGGIFYKLANASKTKCVDGTKQERCYAASTDWDRAGLDDSGFAKVNEGKGSTLVRATIGKRDWGSDLGVFGELRPSEIWPGQLDVLHDGVLVKVEDTGVRCLSAPCPSLREKKLNASSRADLAELGFEGSGATDEQIGQAFDQMHSTGLIISGDRYKVTGPAGSAKARTVTQFWLRATNEICPIIDCAAPPPGCNYEGAVFTPCSQQTCGQLVCAPE